MSETKQQIAFMAMQPSEQAGRYFLFPGSLGHPGGSTLDFTTVFEHATLFSTVDEALERLQRHLLRPANRQSFVGACARFTLIVRESVLQWSDPRPMR